MVHQLTEDDSYRRNEFGENIPAKINGNPRYIATIYYSDESPFLSGHIYRQNVRY